MQEMVYDLFDSLPDKETKNNHNDMNTAIRLIQTNERGRQGIHRI